MINPCIMMSLFGALSISVSLLLCLPSTASAQSDSARYVVGKPRVDTREMVAHPIMNNDDPVFWVSGLNALPPEQDSGKARISKVTVEVVAATIRDYANGNSYTVKVEEQPSFIPVRHYVYTLRLVGPLPLKRGQIKGSVEVRVSAWAEYNGVESWPRIESRTIFISN